ncbi:MAG: hypothetical protein GTO15_03050 [Pseudomonas stutzeri]|nr:hypothetical protein [Stutzerimonas stutzeri]
MTLTKKRRAWIEEYFRCWNATEAARRVGYKHPNTQGPRLLLDVGIQEVIQARLDELKMSADEVLTRLSDQARFDPGPFVIRHPEHEGDLIIDWEALVRAQLTHLVKAVYLTKYGTRIEFHDQQRALELIGKHHGLFVERQEIGGDLTIKVVYDGADSKNQGTP